jgi:hypothetical protein
MHQIIESDSENGSSLERQQIHQGSDSACLAEDMPNWNQLYRTGDLNESCKVYHVSQQTSILYLGDSEHLASTSKVQCFPSRPSRPKIGCIPVLVPNPNPVCYRSLFGFRFTDQRL